MLLIFYYSDLPREHQYGQIVGPEDGIVEC